MSVIKWIRRTEYGTTEYESSCGTYEVTPENWGEGRTSCWCVRGIGKRKYTRTLAEAKRLCQDHADSREQSVTPN